MMIQFLLYLFTVSLHDRLLAIAWMLSVIWLVFLISIIMDNWPNRKPWPYK
jgi:hypothetical protein